MGVRKEKDYMLMKEIETLRDWAYYFIITCSYGN